MYGCRPWTLLKSPFKMICAIIYYITKELKCKDEKLKMFFEQNRETVHNNIFLINNSNNWYSA